MATHELRAAVRERPGGAVIDLAGDIDGAAEDILGRAYAEATSGTSRSVILNFEDATYINSTGIALIVGLLVEARKADVSIGAYGLSDHYREIFEITRLADFMTIAATEDGAVSA